MSRIMGASRNSKPLSTHPVFPVLVALWFAALLGLGTFVVPPASYEALVVGTGLDRLVPAATPPLGATARIAISIAAALAGGLFGLFIAWRVRKAHAANALASEEAEEFEESPWLSDGDDAELPVAVDPEDEIDGEFEDEDRPDWEAWHAELREIEGEQHEPSEEAEPTDTAEAEIATGVDGEPHRDAADMLVAGLPTVAREDLGEDPVAGWLETAEEFAPPRTGRFADYSEPDLDTSEEPEEQAEADGISDSESGEFKQPANTGALTPEEETGLAMSELIARFDAAIAAARAPARPDEAAEAHEGDEQDDPVIAFLRREVERDDRPRGTPPEKSAGESDPKAVLRDALDKLDRVRQTS